MKTWVIAVALIVLPVLAEAQGTATVTENAPIYLNNNSRLQPFRVAAVGTVLQVVKEDRDWLQIEFNDPQWGARIGWIQRKFVNYVSDALKPMDLSVRPTTAGQPPQVVPRQYAPFVPSETEGRVSIGVGYSVVHLIDDELTSPFGWTVSVAGRTGRHVALVGEVSGAYKTLGFGLLKLSAHGFLGGVRFLGEANSSVQPFAQVQAGGVRVAGAYLFFGGSSMGFAVVPGAGVDVRMAERVAVRIAGDYLLFHKDEEWSNAFRINLGVAFSVGR